MLQSATLGFPRIGEKRELKFALEKYWKKDSTESELMRVADTVFRRGIQLQMEAGIALIGVGDFALYDHVLDWIQMLGLTPSRFVRLGLSPIDTYFAMARGAPNTKALDMSKWLNQNYHYEIPELSSSMEEGATDFSKLLRQVKMAIEMAGASRVSPIIFGPCTIVHLAKITDGSDPASLVARLVPKYVECINQLSKLGVSEIQIHEPVLVKSGMASWQRIFESTYAAICKPGVPINLVTYFDDLKETFSFVSKLPVSKISMDFTVGENIQIIESGAFPADKQLGAGIIDSLTPYRTMAEASSTLDRLAKCGLKTLKPMVVQPSSSLIYLPYDINAEPRLSDALKQKLGFTAQKLQDVVFFAKGGRVPEQLSSGADAVVLADALFTRNDNASSRLRTQAAALGLPAMWTSTIGSFPQTERLRACRLQFRKGAISEEEYDREVQQYISYCIGVQEGAGLDVLVHGEPERSDMVEYFAEQLEGFIFTQNGWVQSYGSRCTRPPIVVSDIRHLKPMTVKEWRMAQDIAGRKLVKGMLTGPITILNWSFPRKDLPKLEQAQQLGLALRAEIDALQAAGCKIIQVDDPALREGLPLRASRQKAYLQGAVNAFRLATASARPDVRVVTHFCYSEFSEIIDSIAAMDADEITIEASRSGEEGVETVRALLDACASDISPGVWDVHSPEVPAVEDIKQLLAMYTQGLSTAQLARVGVVPDCGLKTRRWPETIASLRNLVLATHAMRCPA